MPLVFTLAFRNLFHDRLRFIATVIGIVFSIVLVTIQMGLYLGFGRMVTTMIDHASADLWVMPRGTKCFEDPSLLNARERYRALAIDGVVEAIPVVIGERAWVDLINDCAAPPIGITGTGHARILGGMSRRCGRLISASAVHPAAPEDARKDVDSHRRLRLC